MVRPPLPSNDVETTVSEATVWPLPCLGAGIPPAATTVRFRVPPAPRSEGHASAWLALQGRPHAGSFLEGLTVSPAGAVYAVDLAWGRVLELLETGEVRTLLEYDGQPNGLALTRDGGALIADYEHGLLRVERLGPGARVAPLLTRHGMDRFKGLNDVLVAGDGAVYFSDQGGTGLHDPSGRIYRLGADGDLRVLVDGLPSPNALALDEHARVLYAAVTRDNAVWRIPLRADGTVAKVGRYLQLSGGGGPDGLALTPAGWLLVTHLGLGVVWLFDAVGRPVQAYRCESGDDPTSVTVAPDGATALIAEAGSGTVLAAPLPPPSTAQRRSP
jgi:gluconolactonase